MKPNFALSLSQDGVVLYRRAPTGWVTCGTARPEGPDFDAEMRALGARAAKSAAPAAVTTKLIVPNSQILFADLDAPGPDRASRRSQIMAALDGRTPYALDDLVFDWSGTGRKVQVAVVARVTLEEAESFAEHYGLAPVAFVAAPEDGHFAGEPWFGTTSRAGDHIPFGERVDRDQDPVRARDATEEIPLPVAVVSDAVPEALPETPVAEAEPVQDIAEVAQNEPLQGEALKDEAPQDEAPFIAIDDPDDDQPAVHEPMVRDEPVSTPVEVTPTDLAALGSDQPEVANGQVEEPPATDLPDEALNNDAGADTMAEAGFASDEPPTPIPDVMSDDRGGADPDIAVRIDAPVVPDTTEPEPEALPFATRRHRGRDRPALTARRAKRGETLPEAPPISRPAAAVPAVLPDPGAAEDTTPAEQHVDLSGDPVTSVATSASDMRPVTPAPLTAPPRNDVVRPVRAQTTPAATRKGTALRRVLARAASAAASPKPLRTKRKSPAAEEADLTIFGARRTAEVGGKPRHLGLILTGVLVALMVLAAFLPQMFGSNTDEPATTTTGTATEAPIAAPAEDVAIADLPPLDDSAEVIPPADDPAASGVLDTAATTPTETTDTIDNAGMTTATSDGTAAATDAAPAAETPVVVAAADPVDEPATAPATTSAVPAPETTGVPSAAGQATAVWGVAQGLAEDLDSSTIRRDPGDALPDDVVAALPATEALAAEAGPLREAQPAPYASLVRLGPDGLIIATPEGVLTPDGFMLFAGKPSLVPAARPEGLVPAVAPAPTAGTAAAPDAPIVDAPPLALPGIPATRPLSRPAGLAPSDDASAAPEVAAPSETAGTTTATAASPLPAPADPRHAALKPRVRSETIAARAALRAETEAAIAAAAAAAESAAPATFETATNAAVASSKRPAVRPSSITQAVEAALAAAVAEPAPEVQLAAAAAVTPEARPQTPAEQPAETAAADPVVEEIDEPEPEASAPDVPIRGSVAKQATIRNALDLGKINLIGVYGSSGDRRALVRTENGRFVRVKVGDRLDGGKVAAIGEGELSYVKNGRTIVLKMIRDS